ncbi:MAG: plastocyanin/azurin family copper-binding protein [Blastococcus sp.]
MSRPSRIPLPARRLGALAAGLVLAVLVLTGCGSSDKPEGGATPTTAESAESSSAGSGTPAKTVGADGTITATEAEFSISIGGDTVAAGPYLVKVENAGQATHDLVVEQNGTKIASTSPIAPGQSASLSVTLKPGTYVFYCSIGNHRAMGMEMTVHVA